MNAEKNMQRMKEAGIRFRRGLNEAELNSAEVLYGIRFPAPLRDLLRLGLPVRQEGAEEESVCLFPRWNDFTKENEARLRDWVASPIRWLRQDVTKSGFWVKGWGEKPDEPEEIAARFDRIAAEAPVLIPVFGHRFIVDGSFADDSPVFSTVGRDIIRYGSNLEGWIEAEFFGGWNKENATAGPAIPFWDDIVRENAIGFVQQLH